MEITASGPIRAKYLVKSKLTHHNHGPLYEMGPVIARDDDGTENEGYFQASPTGECNMRFKTEADPGLEVGAFYYFTFEPTTEADKNADCWWSLDERKETIYGITFTLNPSGKDHPYSWGTRFVVEVDSQFTKADFGQPGGVFHLRIEKANG
jgi:hypothetical protein